MTTSMVPRCAVLLVNLGTPDSPDPTPIRRYLKQFLSDPRVIEVPRIIWWLVLNLVILRLRPSKLVPNYKKIWLKGGSPIKVITREQACGVQQALGRVLGPMVRVDFAMTYGNPSIHSRISELQRAGIERILVLPLYPQYSATTTAATFDAVASSLSRIRNIPEIRFIKRYHNHPDYISALADSITKHWQNARRRGKLLFSFHGIPKSYVEKGDPYYTDSLATTQAVVQYLNLQEHEWSLCFQSRVGAAEWLKPYTDETVTQLGKEGCEALDVICPGFAADCLETLEEIEEENREYYENAGGKDFRYIPALNAKASHIKLLSELCRDNLKGWLPEIACETSAEEQEVTQL